MKIRSEHETVMTFSDLIDALQRAGLPVPRYAKFKTTESGERLVIRWTTEREIDATPATVAPDGVQL